MPKRVTHIITGLAMGGAETMLWQVLQYGDTSAYEMEVISLSGEGDSQYYLKEIRALGIPVAAVSFKRRPVSSVFRICRILRHTDTLCLLKTCRGHGVGDILLLKSRIDTANELERLKIQCRQRDQELKVMQRVVSNLPALLGKLNDRRSSLKQDYDHYLVHRERLSNAERREFGEELLEALKGNAFSSAERWFDDLHGFRVLLPAFMKQDRPAVLMEGASGARYDVDMRDAKPAGCIQRIEHVLSHLEERIKTADADIARAKAQAEHARAEIRKGNSYTGEVARVSENLMDIDEELNRRAEENA